MAACSCRVTMCDTGNEREETYPPRGYRPNKDEGAAMAMELPLKAVALPDDWPRAPGAAESRRNAAGDLLLHAPGAVARRCSGAGASLAGRFGGTVPSAPAEGFDASPLEGFTFVNNPLTNVNFLFPRWLRKEMGFLASSSVNAR